MHDHRDNLIRHDGKQAAEEVALFRKAGGASLADCSCIGVDREPREGVGDTGLKAGVSGAALPDEKDTLAAAKAGQYRAIITGDGIVPGMKVLNIAKES